MYLFVFNRSEPRGHLHRLRMEEEAMVRGLDELRQRIARAEGDRRQEEHRVDLDEGASIDETMKC